MIKSILKGSFAAVLGVALLATPAASQVKWQLGLGPTLPMGDFGDAFNLGLNVMGGANFGMETYPISWRADATYNMNKCDGCGDITSSLLTLNGDIQYNFPTPTNHPYVLGGLTWGRASLGGDDAPPGLDAQSDIGFNVGGGIHFNLGATPAFLEARYFSIGGDVDADFIPVTFGIRF